MMTILRILILLVLVVIAGCAVLFGGASDDVRVAAKFATPEGGQFQMLVYPNKGDVFTSAVNAFYLAPGEDKWSHYYVSHEAPLRGWNADISDDKRFIRIKWLGSTEQLIESATGHLYTEAGALHLKKKFYIHGEPIDAPYPVKTHER